MLIGHADMFRAKPSIFAMFFRYNLLPSLAFLLVWGITTTQWRSRQPCTKHNVFRGVLFPTCYGRTADNSHVPSHWLHPSKTQCFCKPTGTSLGGTKDAPQDGDPNEVVLGWQQQAATAIIARLRCTLHVDVDTPCGALMLFQRIRHGAAHVR